MDEAVQTFVNYVMENCKTADQMQELLKTVKNALGGTDSCDPKINTCCYIMKKGNSKGQLCGKPSSL